MPPLGRLNQLRRCQPASHITSWPSASLNIHSTTPSSAAGRGCAGSWQRAGHPGWQGGRCAHFWETRAWRESQTPGVWPDPCLPWLAAGGSPDCQCSCLDRHGALVSCAPPAPLPKKDPRHLQPLEALVPGLSRHSCTAAWPAKGEHFLTEHVPTLPHLCVQTWRQSAGCSLRRGSCSCWLMPPPRLFATLRAAPTAPASCAGMP